MRSADRVAGTPDRTPAGDTDRGFSSLRPFRHRSFTLLSNVIEMEHNTAKSAIGNIH